MPKLDKCHHAVVNALEQDGWEITTSRYIPTATRAVHIDLEAAKGTNGQHETVFLAEVKCFTQDTTEELYQAIGQYLIYRLILEEANLTVPLYLAVPKHIYESSFDKIAVRAITEYRIKMVIIDVDSEVIVRWINH